MSLQDTEKLFIEPKDELPEILEAISSSSKEKVILVIPSSSLLLSSLITLKILFREILKVKKNVIVVTEDQYGFFASQRAGFVVVNKVSQITSDLWDISFNKIFKNTSKKNRNSEQIENLENIENIEDDESMSQYQEESKFDGDHEPSHLDETAMSDLNQRSEQFYPRKREQRVINIDGIEVFGGGDIKNIKIEPENDKIEEFNFENEEMSKKSLISSNGGFTGKDFTRYVKKDSFFSNLLSKFRFRRKVKSFSEDSDKELGFWGKNKKKIILGTGLVILVLFLVALIIVQRSSSVDISIRLNDEGIKELKEQKINGDLLSTEIDFENLVVPVVEYKVDKIGTSKTGTATGVSRTGTKARGIVTIYNTTSPAKEVSLKKGTKIKNIGSNLEFILLEDVILSAPQIGGAGELTASLKDDVSVESAEIGNEYNLKIEAGETLKFSVDGFATTQVDVTGFKSFEGGSASEITVVSEQDIESLKKSVMQELDKEARARLINLAPNGFTLIQNSMSVKEDQVVAFPALNERSDDKTFSLNIEVSVKGYFVRNDFISRLARQLLLSQKEENENIDITDIKDASLELITIQDSKFELKLSSTGKFKVVLNIDELKEEIRGISLVEAREVLTSKQDIRDIRIGYSPFFVPESLQYIPTDLSRINIRMQ